MIFRVYVSKKDQYTLEENALLADINNNLFIKELENIKIYKRYDVSNINEQDFKRCINGVFSEPQIDDVFDEIDLSGNTFAVEYLPGQFDQRSDSASQCIQFVTGGVRPNVRSAKVYKLFGDISNEQIEKIKSYIINPVESRLASLEIQEFEQYDEKPEKTPIMEGFIDLDAEGLENFIKENKLAMDVYDAKFCQNYFKNEERRNPTLTELKMIDTYWSDHCRHTTFMTHIEDVDIEHEAVKASYEKYLNVREELYKNGNRPITLMDLATIGGRFLKKTGKLKNIDESEEINACSVKINVLTDDGKSEKWLLMFKNETHNHPTEIEPFGGAATCLGGAIRDPLSGRSYVYQAMRVTGAGNPLNPIDQTIKGKLPQIKICQTAAAGYSSYGNQIGIATGHVSEIYHNNFVAKRMEVGAVIGAVPAKNVIRKTPKAGDVVILVGGATGRDGCGGATGSSKTHDLSSLSSCGAEVQKGNAPEERKLQRLFRNSEVTKLIKRCNDFGAGGVSVAIGELADGLDINLDAIPKKYEGLSGTELAISESQERMAVVVAKSNVKAFIKAAEQENLRAVAVAAVTDKNRLEMTWQGNKIVSICRDFLNSAGAVKKTAVCIKQDSVSENIEQNWEQVIGSLNVASQRGLIEQFDSTIGASTVLMPFGGKRQLTPTQAMVSLIPVLGKQTSTCSVMAYGYDPYLAMQSPYYGAYYAVVSSVAKVIGCGGSIKNIWLSFQEYFERLKDDRAKWGKPFSALLGAFAAQLMLEIGSIGGKDSMSGSFEDLDVPPTLISFAVSVSDAENIISPEFKKAGTNIYLIEPKKQANGLLDAYSLKNVFKNTEKAIKEKRIISAYAIGQGGVCEAITKMCFGNAIGAKLNKSITNDEIFQKKYGAFVVECEGKLNFGKKIGVTTNKYIIEACGNTFDVDKLEEIYNKTLEPVYRTKTKDEPVNYEKACYYTRNKLLPKFRTVQPKVLIPVFPGTNCEYDTAFAFEKYGASCKILVVKNQSKEQITQTVKEFAQVISQSQIMAIPGGFSGGDEPDGSAKFIVSLLKNPIIADEIMQLLNRDGLMLGICNGFQALLKLGLISYGKITEQAESMPTLTFNSIGRHQSKIANTIVASVKSPWFMHHNVGDINKIVISNGEGRFIATQDEISKLIENGQIATQYVDLDGNPTSDILFNPSNSMFAVEGLTSPDGKILGKMGHSERFRQNLYKNIENCSEQLIFKAAVDYFK